MSQGQRVGELGWLTGFDGSKKIDDMMHEYATLSISFAFLVAVLYSALIMGALWANNRVDDSRRWSVRWLRILVGGFLLVVGIFSLDHVFSDFTGMPPKIMMAVGTAFIGTLAIAFNPQTKRWLEEVPQTWLIGFQAFRIVVEIQLYFLAMTTFFPKMMTLEGANFDFITGMIAIPIALSVKKLEQSGNMKRAGQFVAFFNVVGLALLVNVMGRGMLSLPTEIRAIHVENPPIAVAMFPFIWLPTFVVPFALLLHLLSLRKLALGK